MPSDLTWIVPFGGGGPCPTTITRYPVSGSGLRSLAVTAIATGVSWVVTAESSAATGSC
jgi:hypothetical protein